MTTEEITSRYCAALDAEKAYSAACVAEYGKDACNMRYSYNQPPHIALLAEAKHKADAAWIAVFHRT